MAFEQYMSEWEKDLRRALEEEQADGLQAPPQEGYSLRSFPFQTRQEAVQELESLQVNRDALAMLPRMMEVDQANRAARDLGIPLLFTYGGVYSPAGYRPMPEAGALSRAAWGMEDAGDEPGQGFLSKRDPSASGGSVPGSAVPPFRALASAGAATDTGFSNRDPAAYKQNTAQEPTVAPGGKAEEDEDVSYADIVGHPSGYDVPTGPNGEEEEAYYTDILPLLPESNVSAAEPTPESSKYKIDLVGRGGYANNRDVYPEADELSRMPLEYLKQAQAQMKAEGVIYADDFIIKQDTDPMEADCVGMLVMPAMTWYSEDMFEYLKGPKVSKIKTNVEYTYSNSTHHGEFTKEMIDNDQMFDGMQLMGKVDGKPHHIVTFYKEFVCDGVTYHNVVVDITSKYDDPKTPEKEKDNQVKIRPFEDAYKEGRYKYWCAPDYIDYGDQTDPITGELLTPSRQWKRKDK